MSDFVGTGVCACGCGQPTPRWNQTCASKGVKKGDYRRFVAGHYKKYKSIEDKPKALCHPERVAKARGMCGSCYNKWRDDNDLEAKKEKLKRRREVAKKSRESDPFHAEKRRNRVLRHRYGIDVDEYNKLFERQDGKCAICKTPAGSTKGTKLFVDHQHDTTKTRELLCAKCNTALGFLENGVDRLLEYGAYLLRHDPAHPVGKALCALEQIREEPKSS